MGRFRAETIERWRATHEWLFGRGRWREDDAVEDYMPGGKYEFETGTGPSKPVKKKPSKKRKS